MSFTVGFGNQFAREWKNYLPDQKTKVGEFIQLFQTHGLADQTKYPGRVSPSWFGLPPNHPNHAYTITHSLWHYHIGLPHYTGTATWGNTSDWVLHFQWVSQGSHIDIVDMNTHHNSKGSFYLPPATNLVP